MKSIKMKMFLPRIKELKTVDERIGKLEDDFISKLDETEFRTL